MKELLKKILSKRKVFVLGDDLQFHEVNSPRMKSAAIAAGSAITALAALLLLNHVSGNFLGMGYETVAGLESENARLRERVEELQGSLDGLRSDMDKLKETGDELRLLVDLPPMDEGVKEAGAGGAVAVPGAEFSDLDGSEFLHKAGNVLSAISSELKLQQQSYEQIANKHEYNKKYFAALPAIKPIRGWYSAGKFGMRMHPILGVLKNHRGLDIVADVGTEVVASGDGVVSMAGHSGGGLGNIVVIDHGFGYQTLYAHLSKITTKRGKSVRRGDVIAKSGKTGLTSGPHLHYEVRHNGRPKNPADFFFDDVTPEEIRALRAERQAK